jgi:dGTPase
MEWSKLLSYKKFPTGSDKFDITRTPFQEDYDRIIFSEPFRRLAGKTQVHPLKENDHVHSRLPHSLEVSSVGRSLGSITAKRLIAEGKLPLYENVSEDAMIITVGQIVQTACLAHDIGNPPFGHAGESIIQEWFKRNKDSKILSELTDEEYNDFANFEGNAQALRLLTRLTMSKNEGGIRPSYAILGTMMKYPWEYSGQSKFCSFQSEKDYLKNIGENCGMLFQSDYKLIRHPLAFLSEAADDICYNIMDLEDAYELGILEYDEIAEILIEICSNNPKFDSTPFTNANNKNELAYLRALATYQCITAVIDEFFDKYELIMSGELSYKHNLMENCRESVSEPMKKAKELSRSKVFTTQSKRQLEEYADEILSYLLDKFVNAVHSYITDQALDADTEYILKIMGEDLPPKDSSHYDAFLKVTDFISGMTDKYAVTTSIEIANRLHSSY